MTVKCKFTQSLLHHRTLLHQLAILLLLLLWTGLAIQPLYAHAEYDHSEPAADAVVESAPTQVRVWFTQELFRRKGENSIEVYQADGTRVDLDDLVIDDDDRKLMTISLKPAVPAGLYTVRWVATSSEDGHQEKGEFTFTIGAAAGAGAVEAATATSVSVVVAEPAATEPPPTAVATPAEQDAPFSCFGVTLPLMMVMGAVVIGQRRNQVG